MRLLHAFAFSKWLHWLAQTSGITLKTQQHAVNVENDCRNSALRTHYLSCVATVVLRMRLLHFVACSKQLCWLAQTKVITLKTQLHAVNARWKQQSQRSFKYALHYLCYVFQSNEVGSSITRTLQLRNTIRKKYVFI